MVEEKRLTDQQIADLDRRIREDLIEWSMKDKGYLERRSNAVGRRHAHLIKPVEAQSLTVMQW